MIAILLMIYWYNYLTCFDGWIIIAYEKTGATVNSGSQIQVAEKAIKVFQEFIPWVVNIKKLSLPI
jgi:hypothetical protein